MVKKVKKDMTGFSDDPQAPPGREELRTAPVARTREEVLLEKLQEAEKKAAENYDKYVRAVADFENYKKRAVRDKAEAIKYGNEDVLRDLLPIIDNMERALEHARTSDDFDAFKKGLKLLQEQFFCCLQKHGVEQIPAIGKDFDPHVHEAMMQVESDRHGDSQVVGELEKGYLLQGRLLRPAKVSVCKRPKAGDQQACEDGN